MLKVFCACGKVVYQRDDGQEGVTEREGGLCAECLANGGEYSKSSSWQKVDPPLKDIDSISQKIQSRRPKKSTTTNSRGRKTLESKRNVSLRQILIAPSFFHHFASILDKRDGKILKEISAEIERIDPTEEIELPTGVNLQGLIEKPNEVLYMDGVKAWFREFLPDKIFKQIYGKGE